MQLGLGSFCCSIAAPVALILGLLAKKDIAANPGRYGNGWHATVAVWCGGAMTGLLLLAVIAAALAPKKTTSPRPTVASEPASVASVAPVAPTPPAVTRPSKIHVTRADFGDAWPLTVEEGELSCEDWPGKAFHAVVFVASGRRYAVNGAAANVGVDIKPIWARDEELSRKARGADMRKSIGPLINRGLALCSGD